jgi:hypothetical protein
MSAAPWPIAEIEIIGGHCCPRPPAPFGRGPAVVRLRSDPNRICIAFKLDRHGASGDSLTQPQWRGLVESFNALELPAPILARPHAALWVFTNAFGPTCGSCLSGLRERQALLNSPPEPGSLQIARNSTGDDKGPILALVDEYLARPLRPEWRNEARDEAWKHLQRGDLANAQRNAERALSLPPQPATEDLALLSLIYSLNGSLTRSTALRAVACNTYGAKTGENFDAEFERLQRRLPAMTQTATSETPEVPATSSPALRLRLIERSNEGRSKS